MDKPAALIDPDAPSFTPLPVPTVLVIGGPGALLSATQRVAAADGLGVAVEVCDAAGALLAAARLRPFALVLSQEVYGFDPDRLGAVASELEAELVVLKVHRVSAGFLEQALRPALRHALRRYRSTVASGPVRK